MPQEIGPRTFRGRGCQMTRRLREMDGRYRRAVLCLLAAIMFGLLPYAAVVPASAFTFESNWEPANRLEEGIHLATCGTWQSLPGSRFESPPPMQITSGSSVHSLLELPNSLVKSHRIVMLPTRIRVYHGPPEPAKSGIGTQEIERYIEEYAIEEYIRGVVQAETPPDYMRDISSTYYA